MAVAVVASTPAVTASTSSATTVAVTLGAAVSIGHVIYVSLSHSAVGASLPATVADSLGNTYALQGGGKMHDSTNTQSGEVYVCTVTTGGTPTITATFRDSAGVTTSESFRRIAAVAFSGVDTTTPVNDHTQPVSGTVGTSATGTDATTSAGTVNPSLSGCMIVATVQDTSGSITWTPCATPAFTEAIESAGGEVEIEYYLQAAAASIGGKWTASVAGHRILTAVTALAPSGGGGGGGVGTGRMTLLGAG